MLGKINLQRHILISIEIRFYSKSKKYIMTNSSFLKKLLFAFGIVFFVSCNDDFNEIGSDIVGDDIHTDMVQHIVDVTAYDRPTGAVQSNNLSQNQLGVYSNTYFGKTVSHFVTQLELATENPTLYEPEVDSVYIYIPYNIDASKTTTGSDGKTTYALDTNYFFGDLASTFKLEIFRNGFYLRDSDPAAADKLQRYYSDDKAMVDALTVGNALFTKTDFKFSPEEHEIKANIEGGTQNKLIEKKAPGLFTYLDKDYFEEVLMSTANRGNLLNNNLFKNYFRGLYFKVTQGTGAVMGLPRFSEGTITIKYRDWPSRTDGVEGPDKSVEEKPRKTITLNLKGNTINFFENSPEVAFQSAITTSSPTEGDERLYLKGGAGSMTIINLDDAQIKALTAAQMGQKVLINEANLVFHVDDSQMNNLKDADKPYRIYLYDLKNRTPIYDYLIDGTSSASNPKGNKGNYGGVRTTIEMNGKAHDIYKIRLTNHVNNIINGDSTNVKLGLVVTDNINVVGNGNLKTPFTEDGTEVKQTPVSATNSLFGTILYGNNIPATSDDYNKRLKLEIYYTKPK